MRPFKMTAVTTDSDPSSRSGPEPDAETLFVLIPTFNDWEALRLLLVDLEAVLAREELQAEVLLVDDGSTVPAPVDLIPNSSVALTRIDLMTLRRNVGHQRAIAIGLSYLEANRTPSAVVVMDGDGEDAPRDVPRLLGRMQEQGGTHIVFAERTRRSESLLFRVCYFFYRHVHWLLTGIPVRVGNFSVVPYVQLRRLVVVSDLWNHFSAAVHRARLPLSRVPCERAARLSGSGKMNFVALVGHGLSAMSVFGDRIGVRMLIASSSLVLLSFIALLAMALSGAVFGQGASPALLWSAGLLVVVLSQALLFSFVFVFIVLASRNMSGFVPAREHALFVDTVRTLKVAGAERARSDG